MIFARSGMVNRRRSVSLVIAAAKEITKNVERERHHEQGQAGREQRLILDGAVCWVATAGGNDIGGNGLGFIQWIQCELRNVATRDGDDDRLADGPRDSQDVSRANAR